MLAHGDALADPEPSEGTHRRPSSEFASQQGARVLQHRSTSGLLRDPPATFTVDQITDPSPVQRSSAARFVAVWQRFVSTPACAQIANRFGGRRTTTAKTLAHKVLSPWISEMSRSVWQRIASCPATAARTRITNRGRKCGCGDRKISVSASTSTPSGSAQHPAQRCAAS